MKLHRPVRNFPEVLRMYAINFCYNPNRYNYSSPFLSEVLDRPELVTELYEFLKGLPQDEDRAIPLKKNIVCEDVINPHTIPDIDLCFDETTNLWDIPKKVSITRYNVHNLDFPREKILNRGNYTLIQDEAFLLAIHDYVSHVEMYIYKK